MLWRALLGIVGYLAASILPNSCKNQKCLQILLHVSRGTKLLRATLQSLPQCLGLTIMLYTPLPTPAGFMQKSDGDRGGHGQRQDSLRNTPESLRFDCKRLGRDGTRVVSLRTSAVTKLGCQLRARMPTHCKGTEPVPQ